MEFVKFGGKRLIQAKELIPHGEWANWLQNNFNLSQESARKFMRCSEKFGKSTTSWILKPSQMFELLALPEGDEEKFIAEKATEGTPVQDITTSSYLRIISKFPNEVQAALAN